MRCSVSPERSTRTTPSVCTAMTAYHIPHLALEGSKLTCPKHQWAFDIRSGDCIAKGDSPLRQWPSKVVKGRLLACW